MIYLRSILYNVVLCLSLLVYAPLAVLSFPLPILVRSRFIALWARFQLWSLRHVCRLDYQIEGRGNLPPGPAIVFSKHQSAWETLAYQVILPPLTWVLKRELLWIPLFGWGLAMLRPIAIKRGTGRRAVDQVVKQGTDRLADGLWVLIFPEGTRLPPRTRRKYKQGGAILAAESGYPVVPIAHNAGSFWPRRGFVKRPGVIRVAIGPVIESRGRSAAEITKLSEDWIESTMKELES
ncbi:MAG: lysophospholipid acyltransferase family protein [Gammaproteobacteria bacterium]|nr:lysophospholipid acyltransferase family protein [Gammaproteobacteria bacterium]